MNFELKIQAPQNAPVIWNFEELRDELTTALADFSNRTYSEETIAEAKEDSAKLNKLKDAINAERISREKEYMQPFLTFKEQANELCKLIDEANAGIKNQLDTFEAKRVAEKVERIKALFMDIVSNYDISFLEISMMANKKWLNKGTSEKAIAKEITERCEQIIKDMEVIKRMPSYSFEATEVYKQTLDLNKALTEGEKMAEIQSRKRQEALEKAQEQVAEDSEPKYPLRFACELTIAQAKALKAFCEANGIELKQIKE